MDPPADDRQGWQQARRQRWRTRTCRAVGSMQYDVHMRVASRSVVHSDPEISGGTPVFRGTRVPVQSLFDYMQGGESIEQFLDQFPSVSKEQALAVLELACDSPNHPAGPDRAVSGTFQE